jgi:hypothetical protein
VTATASTNRVPVGGSATLTGSVTKTFGGATVPAGAIRVAAFFTPTGSTTRTLVSSVTTTSTGTFTLRVLPKASGTWTVVLSPVAGYAGSESAGLGITVG